MVALRGCITLRSMSCWSSFINASASFLPKLSQSFLGGHLFREKTIVVCGGLFRVETRRPLTCLSLATRPASSEAMNRSCSVMGGLKRRGRRGVVIFVVVSHGGLKRRGRRGVVILAAVGRCRRPLCSVRHGDMVPGVIGCSRFAAIILDVILDVILLASVVWCPIIILENILFVPWG